MIQILRKRPHMVYMGISVILLLSGHSYSFGASGPKEHGSAPFESMALFDAAEKTRLAHYFDQSSDYEMPVEISMPHLGIIPLQRRVDSYSGRSLLQSTLEVDALSLPGDVVQLSSFALMVLDTSECVLQSEALVFGAPAIVELESIQRRASMRQRHEIDVEVTSAVFRLLLRRNPEVEVAPGYRVALEDAELVLEEGQPPVLIAEAEFLSELVELRFVLSDDALELTFPLDRFELAELDESLSESSIGLVGLTDVTFTTRYEDNQLRTSFAGRLDPATLPDECVRFKSDRVDSYQVRGEFIRVTDHAAIDSMADGEHEPESEMVADATRSQISESSDVLVGEPGGLHLVVSNCVCQVPFLGSFEDAELTICSGQTEGSRSQLSSCEGSMSMRADGIFWFDEEQRVPYDLRLEWQGDACFMQGVLSESVFLPKIVLENGSFVLDPNEEKLQLSGTAMLGDMKTDAVVTIDVSQEAGPAAITVQSVGAHRPFDDRPIANIEDIELSHVEGAIPIFDDTIQLTGQAKILGNEFPVVVEWADGLGFTPTIKAAIPKGSRFQEFFPRLAGTPLGRLVFDDAWLVASARDYQDPTSQVVYQAGLTIHGDAQFTGALETLSTLVPEAVRSVRVYGKIEPEHEKTTLVGPLPLNVPFANDVVNLGPVVYQVGADLNWLLTTVGVRVGDGELIRFAGPLSITDRSIKGSLHADAGWQQPCGLPNISFRDLKLDLELDVEQVKKRALPDKLVLDMKLDFLDYPLRFTGIADNAFKSLVFTSSLRKLYLADLVYFLSDRLSIPSDRTLVPPLELYGVKITCSPQETHAGADFINQGVHLAGSTTLLGQKIGLTAEATTRGCVGTGTLKSIEREGMRFCAENENDVGPAVRLAFCEDEQGLNIAGRFVVDSLLDEKVRFDYQAPQKFQAEKMVALGKLSQPVSMCLEVDEFTTDPVFDVSLDFRTHERDFYASMIHEMACAAQERLVREREMATERAEVHQAEQRVASEMSAPRKLLPAVKHPRLCDKKLRAMATAIRDLKKGISEFEEEIRQTRLKIDEFENSRGASRASKRYESEAERISSELKAAQKQLEIYEAEYKRLKAPQRGVSDVGQERRSVIDEQEEFMVIEHAPASVASSGYRPRFMSSSSSQQPQSTTSDSAHSSDQASKPVSRSAILHAKQSRDTRDSLKQQASRSFRRASFDKQPIGAGAAMPLNKPTDMSSPYSASCASHSPTASVDSEGVREPVVCRSLPEDVSACTTDAALTLSRDEQLPCEEASCSTDSGSGEAQGVLPALECDIRVDAIKLLKAIRLDEISWHGRCENMRHGVLLGLIVRCSTDDGPRVIHFDCNVSEGDETFVREIVRAIQGRAV